MAENSDGFTVKYFLRTQRTQRLINGVAHIIIEDDKFQLKPLSKDTDIVFFPSEFVANFPKKFVNKIELEFNQPHSYKCLILEATHTNSNFGADSHFRVLTDGLRCLFASQAPYLDDVSVLSSPTFATPSSTRAPSRMATPTTTSTSSSIRTNRNAQTSSSIRTSSNAQYSPSIRSNSNIQSSPSVRSSSNVLSPPSINNSIAQSPPSIWTNSNIQSPPSVRSSSNVLSSPSIKTQSKAQSPSSIINNSNVLSSPSVRTSSNVLSSPSIRTNSNSQSSSSIKTPTSSRPHSSSSGSHEKTSVPISCFYGTPTSSRNVTKTPGTNSLRAVPKSAPMSSLTKLANDYKTTPARVPSPSIKPKIREMIEETSKSLALQSSTSASSSRKSAFTQKTASTSCTKDDELQIEVVQLDEDDDYTAEEVSPSERTNKSLRNIGNSCYSNAVLQVLGCLDRFRKEIAEITLSLSKDNKNSVFMETLLSILSRLSDHNKKRGIQVEVLVEFRKLAGKHLGEQFATTDQQDASEFFNYLLDYLQNADGLSNNPSELFRIENDQLIFCKCGASRHKTEVENMLTVSLGRSRRPSMRKVIDQFFVEEKVKIDCDSCKMKSRLAGRFVSIKHLPKYLAISVRRYDFKNDSVEKVNSSIHVNKNLYLKSLCFDSKANEAKDFCRVIRDASESPRKLPLMDHRAALRNILQKGGTPMGSYVDERDHLVSSRKRKMGENDLPLLIPIAPPTSVPNTTITLASTPPSPFSSIRLSSSNSPFAINESFSSEPKIETEKTPKKVIAFHPLRTNVIQDLQCIARKKCIPMHPESDVDTWRKSNIHRSCGTDLEVEPHIKIVEGDGNCLFRSLSWWIFCGNEKGHRMLRDRICDFLEKHSEHFSGLLDTVETIDDHILDMRKEGTWGTNVEISAAATLFNIVIFTYFESWKIFRPLFEVKNGEFMERLKLDGDQIDALIKEKGSIYIHNQSNAHFSPAYAPKLFFEEESAFSVEVKKFTVDPQNAILKTKIVKSPVRVVARAEAEISSEDEEKVLHEFKMEDDPMYSLVGIVAHHGPNVHSGHYTSFCYDSLLGVWLDCNDERIREVEESFVLEQSAKSGYLFFYERRRDGDSMSFEKRRDD